MSDRFELMADELVANAREAHARFLELDQESVDEIVAAAFRVAFDARFDLAERAWKETRLGLLEHKVIKNAWASLIVYDSIRGLRTVGEISHDETAGITEIAYPLGPILALLPVTNPTSTAVFKALICLKTRNPVIFSPHGAAKKSSREAARIVYEAAVAAGAPENCIQWMKLAHKDLFDNLSRHRGLALILATTTGDMVRRAQRSGTPTLGVGPGNVPVYVDRSADFQEAARKIMHSKTFDNGTVCASEQALIVTTEVWAGLRGELEALGAHVCSAAEVEQLGPVVFNTAERSMRADAVGQPALKIAERAGFEVPERTRLLIGETGGVGADHPLSHEILAPVLALYVVPDEAEALSRCAEVLALGGEGHTAGIYASDEDVVLRWRERLHAGRMLVNIPTTTGAIGGVMNKLDPSLTLGCGTHAGNVSMDNITVENLLNVCRLTRERVNETWIGLYPDRLLDPTMKLSDWKGES